MSKANKKYLVIREIDILLNEGNNSLLDESIMGIFDTEKEAQKTRDALDKKGYDPKKVMDSFRQRPDEGWESAEESPDDAVTVMYEVREFDGKPLCITNNIISNM